MAISLRNTALILVIGCMIGFGVLPGIVSAQEQARNCFTQGALISGAAYEIVPTTCPDGVAAGTLVANKNLSESTWVLWIYQALSGIGAFIAWLGGSLLDVSISIFTVGMAETSESFGFTTTIVALWGIIRDLFNILFIFGLIFAGFQLILGTNEAGSKKLIGSIVIAALLINFSLYATQVVVDFSNVAAYQIHQAILPPEGERPAKVLGYDITNISSNFVNMANLERLSSNSQQIAGEAKIPGGLAGSLILGILMMAFYGLLGFVFAAGAFILFSRFIALLFLMIFSPILFLGWIMPGMKGMSSKWTKYLFNQALVGPAFLFMLYIALRAMQGMGELTNPTIMGMMVYILIVAAFVMAALKAAQSLSSWGGLQAYNIGSALERRFRVAAGGATAGLAARGLRNTAGRLANWGSENKTLLDASSGRGLTGWASRRALSATDKLKDASFDARKVAGVGKTLGIGEGLNGGYKTKTEEIAKQEKAFADRLGTVDDDDKRVSELQLEVEAHEQAMEAKKKQMKEWQDQITQFEIDKKNLTGKKKADKQAEIDINKAKITATRTEVDKHKEDVEKAKENVQKEKSRRQIGVVPQATATALKKKRDDVKDKLAKYAAMPDGTAAEKAAKNAEREDITKLKKELAEAEKTANEEAGGYAYTVESQGLITRLFTGNYKAANDNAAKEIRDEYKKKSKGKDK